MRDSTIGSILLLALTVLMMPLLTMAQQPVRVRRIAFLGFGSLPSAAEPNPLAEAFRQALHARGWVEGHAITIEWRWAEGSSARFATLVAELVQLPVEVLVVPNATTAGIARRATTTIPIVVVGGGSLLEDGLVASLARPGGNITGVHSMAREVVPKQLEVLKQALPEVTRVAVLRGEASFRNSLPALEEMARALEMVLHLFDVREPTAFGPSTLPLEETARLFDVREPTALDNAFAAITSAQMHALFVLGGGFSASSRAQIAALAAQHHLPSICWSRQDAETGCLMSYGPSNAAQGQLIASYVDRILHGARPADLPVEQPMRFEFVINLKTAQALGLTLPPMVLFQADEVIR
jgi:putative ABC transport system substrate-binding protein